MYPELCSNREIFIDKEGESVYSKSMEIVF